MAEGFCRRDWGHLFNVYSAGTKKHGMNERAIKVMKEVGVDLSNHFSKTLDEIKDEMKDGKLDIVVTVCGHANENCPYLPGVKIVHIGFEDPPALTKEMKNEEEILKIYRRVRDEIASAIKNLPRTLDFKKI